MEKSQFSASKKLKKYQDRSTSATGYSGRERGFQRTNPRSSIPLVTSVGTPKPRCQYCNKTHFGECRIKSRACYRCGSFDHFLRNCPKRGEKEVEQTSKPSNLVSMGRPPRPSGNVSGSRGATKDTAGRPENGELLQVKSNQTEELSNVISVMTAQRCVRKGYDAYLAYVLNTKVSESKIQAVPVVCEFLDVFPEELPGLPPEREVEFSIDLMNYSNLHNSVSIYASDESDIQTVLRQLREMGFLEHIVSAEGIRGFSMMASPMTRLLQKDVKFEWTNECQQSFDRLKDLLMKALVLVKAEHQVPSRLLQPITIPERKWERITMDFVSGLPLSPKKKDVIWVIVDRLTKSSHFIPVRMDYSLDKLAELYISEIVRLHGVPISIISDRDSRFTSRFWDKLQEALGTQLHFSTAFYPQTDSQSERVIQLSVQY
ncbi:uncharacterized protein LOC128036232 [Gossypium raimondii]|uniref:uncharacterized protein LOC128036232 n=1 Tax=Gossypium raimondii TaxID=29730 RepID=UPI00227B61DA|nr:uncharacterized protein LOC128036232 [Gossypium raimondii]